ncbi:MAG TPA: hypothetical protein VNP96_01910 [Solirubrobacterales bacterium]|nr:hypothetical protein [Solirubrobacterales bacterium]
MFSSFRNRFGIPGVISVIALVFAMFGGAYAASNSGEDQKASASAKAKQGPRGPRGKTGPAGPAGPQGPAGAPGAKGDTGPAGANGKDGTNGTNGTTGTNGTNGKTVLSGTAIPTGALGTDGDFYIETDEQKIYGPKANGVWPAGVNLKGANGTNGQPWTPDNELPAGATVTGAWSFGTLPSPPAEPLYVPISFPVPLGAELDEAHVHYINPAGKEVVFGEEFTPTDCGSGIGAGVNAANPQAKPGHLCVYAAFTNKLGPLGGPIGIKKASNAAGASTAGALLEWNFMEANARAAGTFAVTAAL